MQEPHIETMGRIVRGTHPRSSGGVHGLVDIATSTFDSLAWAIRDGRERSRIKAAIAEAGVAVPTGRAMEGVIRIAGRVELLEPMATPVGEPAACYLIRTTHEENCECDERCTAVRLVVTTRTLAAPFLVRDESGVAVVDGAGVRLRDFHGRAPDPFEAGNLIARPGDMVTVIGHASLQPHEDPRTKMLSGFRDVNAALVLSGSPAAPTYVFAPPS